MFALHPHVCLAMSLSLRCIASCASNRQKLELVSPIQQEIRGNMWQLCAWPARCSSWGRLNCQSNLPLFSLDFAWRNASATRTHGWINGYHIIYTLYTSVLTFCSAFDYLMWFNSEHRYSESKQKQTASVTSSCSAHVGKGNQSKEPAQIEAQLEGASVAV